MKLRILPIVDSIRLDIQLHVKHSTLIEDILFHLIKCFDVFIQIKNQIFAKLGIPEDEQQLILCKDEGETILLDKKTVFNYLLNRNSTLKLRVVPKPNRQVRRRKSYSKYSYSF